MSDTSVQTAPATATPAAGLDVNTGKAPPPRPVPVSIWWRALRALASLRLTVVLFVLSIILVFYGTLAQIDGGIWNVVNSYFRCFVAWIPLQLNLQFAQVFLWFPRGWHIPGAIPFPGGYILGGLMLINLLAAHLVRFRLTWKRSGILLIHGGMILLLLGELVTAVWAVEGTMTIDQGSSVNYVYHTRDAELAIVEPNLTGDDGQAVDEMTVIPNSLLRPGRTIESDKLPFRVRVLRYLVNSELERAAGAKENPATAGAGTEEVAVELKEVSGVSTQQRIEMPSVYVALSDKEGNDLGTWLFSGWLKSQPVTVDGRTYQVALRFKRTYKPFSLHLLEFRFDRYPGTDTPKNYSSKVVLTDPERNEDREVLIRMNDPLRYRGDTFYQSSFEKTEKTTHLQVVRNPGWLLPYISCTVLTLGLLIHFSITLVGFLQRRAIL
jgi:hypothetical protein